MHLKSESLSSGTEAVTLLACSWSTIRFLENSHRLNGDGEGSKVSPGGPKQLVTPSLSHWRSAAQTMTPQGSNLKTVAKPTSSSSALSRQDSLTPSAKPPADDDPQRSFVLETIRKLKLTRRVVSEQAGIEEFRSMGYWLRGKDLDDPVVKEMGRKLQEWAAKQNVDVPLPRSKGDGSDDDEDEEEASDSPRSAKRGGGLDELARSFLDHPSKRLQLSATGISPVPPEKNSSFAPYTDRRIAPNTPQNQRISRFTGTPSRTPNGPSIPGFHLGTPGHIPDSPYIPFSSPFLASPIPTSIFKPRTGPFGIDEPIKAGLGLTPSQSPMVSPVRGAVQQHPELNDEMFEGEDIVMQTPYASERFARVNHGTPMTSASSAGAPASSRSSGGARRSNPSRRLDYE